MNYSVIKADKGLFAVYQTIYSNADTNLNFDWKRRLNDTNWTEDCFWIMQDEHKMGGIIILDDKTLFPFLITPFCDKWLFWKIVIKHIKQNNLCIGKFCGIPDEDVSVLLSYGYKVDISRRMMCRPTDTYNLKLDIKYTYRIPSISKDISDMVSVTLEGYEGGIDYQISGQGTEEEAKQDIEYFLSGYVKTDTLHQSVLIHEQGTNKLVAYCMAGRHPDENMEGFSFISDITVIPEHRGKGIAEFMLKYSLTEASKSSEVLGLCVTVGNNAESLYHHLGFWGGPRFTEMSKQAKLHKDV